MFGLFQKRWGTRGLRVRLLFLAAASLVIAHLLVLVSPVTAQNRKIENDGKDKLDAVLLLDASGSMLVTDPNRLRDEGARLLAQFLRSGDRLSIVEFSEKPKVLRPLSLYESGQLDQVSKTIQSVKTTGAYTDLLAPIRLAKGLLEKEPREDADQVIILLSDGKMDPDPKIGSSTLLTDELIRLVLPELKEESIRVHTLSLSEQSDRELLARISELTGGVNWYTPSADDIHRSFAELFLVVKKPQTVPLTSKGFKIDGEVQEATFYISREEQAEIVLVSPSGSEIRRSTQQPNIKWFQGKKYEVITLVDPDAGQWQVLGLEKNEGFATLPSSFHHQP